MAEELRPPDATWTEDQAAARPCPLIRFGEDNHQNCFASRCLGWRWARGVMQRFFVTLDGKPEEEWAWNPRGSYEAGRVAVRIVTEPPRGFCGYAGKSANG